MTRKVSVSAEPLRTVLQALIGQPHEIRELQMTRTGKKLLWEDPIGKLVEEFNVEVTSTINEVPIDMVLYCPNCGTQHVDKPEPSKEYRDATGERVLPLGWRNPPHRSHLCHSCGCIWRPADVATNGVEKIETKGKADTWPPVGVNEVFAATATKEPK